MYGCELDDVTGAKTGFELDGYDGEDWMALDMENMRYITTKTQAFPTQQKWNNDRALIEYQKQYLTQTCIEWLNKYLKYGSSTLGRKGTKPHNTDTAHILVMELFWHDYIHVLMCSQRYPLSL